MISYDPQQPLISLHIPKTAGTSLAQALRDWYGDRFFLHYPGGKYSIGDAPWEPGVCIHGHFNKRHGAGLDDCYPQARQIMTVLRDPFERMVSLWRHLRRDQETGRNSVLADYPDFGSWFDAKARQLESDPAAGFIANFFPRRVTSETVRGMFDDQYIFVGITERSGESISRLAQVLGKPAIEIGRENVATDAESGFFDWRARHEQTFTLEHEVYAEALRVFEAGHR